MLVDKMLQFKVPATYSAFHQVRRRALHRSVLQGCSTIFGHEQNNGFQDSPWVSCPCGKGEEGIEEPTSQLYT